MNANQDPKNEDILDIIFEGRNKEYGAYFLRKKYPSHIKKALIGGVLLFAFCLSIPMWAKYLTLGKKEDDKLSDVKVELKKIETKKPDEKKPLPPPPPPKKEPPKPPSVKFTPPVIKKDEDVKEKEPPKVDDITVNTATTTVISDNKDYVPQVEAPPVVSAPVEDDTKVFSFVEQNPSFPGGEDALREYLAKNIKYPAIARDNGIEGRVVLSFQVDKNGRIKDVTVRKGIGGGCDEEAMRVVRNMPEWKPGKQNGKSVNVLYTLPVNFKLQ